MPIGAVSSVGPQDPISSFFDQTFDAAYNLSLKAEDAKHIRWARIDYFDVTEITTRWAIWKSVTSVYLLQHSRTN
jgi:hypothetical protein